MKELLVAVRIQCCCLDRYLLTLCPPASLWTTTILRLHEALLANFVLPVSLTSARYPRFVILICLAITGALGYVAVTNFELVTDQREMWTPRDNSLPHFEWDKEPKEQQRFLQEQGQFSPGQYNLRMIVHADGDYIPMGRDVLQRMTDVIEAIEGLERYDELCSQYGCSVWGAPRYWGSSRAQLDALSDEQLVQIVSDADIVYGVTVPDRLLYGNAVRDANNTLVEVQSLQLMFSYRREQKGGRSWGAVLEQTAKDFNAKWERDSNLRLEGIHETAFANEFERGIVADLYLLPIIFVAMSVFTGAMFVKCHSVRSQCLVGVAAVLSVVLSIVCSLGAAMVFGIPYTTISPLLPFVLFGIGLDDAFIVGGAFSRTKVEDGPVERLRQTMKDVGVSITLTSVTSSLAFAIGCSSTLPAIIWLSYMAFPSIVFIYVFQLTFFTAVLALDARRMQQNRMDLLTCIVRRASNTDGDEDVISPVDRFMEGYAKVLVQTPVRMTVFAIFAVFTAMAALSASKIRQTFDTKDLMPRDSYLVDFIEANENYAYYAPETITVKFRDVLQSDEEVQEQMNLFVDTLVDRLDVIATPPDAFWLKHLQLLVENVPSLSGEPFSYQMDQFMSIPEAQEFYGGDVVRNKNGNVVKSKVAISLDNIRETPIRQQIKNLDLVEEIVNDFPGNNDGRTRPAYYVTSEVFETWQFYRYCVEELTFSAVVGILSVVGVALLFIPHWSASLTVLPLMCIVYIDMLGFLQWFGVSINAVTYVILAMSIGLLVDFLMHVLLRYYESPGTRAEKVIVTLRTMGSSILLGGITTFLGTLPLAFSQSNIFITVFIAFIGLVVLGTTHGLILLPALLASVGTEDVVHSFDGRTTDSDSGREELECATDDIQSGPTQSSSPYPAPPIGQSTRREKKSRKSKREAEGKRFTDDIYSSVPTQSSLPSLPPTINIDQSSRKERKSVKAKLEEEEALEV